MRLRRSVAEPEEPIELNLIPLIDVIMFLLIFFISTTSFMDQQGLKVDKPQAGGQSQGDSETIVLTVAADGKVLHGAQDISLGGVRPTVKRLCGTEALPVVIQADPGAHSGVVIRVMDEARLGGARDVSLAAGPG